MNPPPDNEPRPHAGDCSWDMRKEVEGLNIGRDAPGCVRSPKLPGVELSRDADRVFDQLLVIFHCTYRDCPKQRIITFHGNGTTIQRYGELSKVEMDAKQELYK